MQTQSIPQVVSPVITTHPGGLRSGDANRAFIWQVVPALTFFTLLAIITNGYAYPVNDQFNYIPFILKFLDSDLYGSDYFFLQSSGSKTIWPYAMSILARVWQLETVFLLGYVIALFAYLALIYALGYFMCGDRLMAMAGVLILVIFKPFATMDNYFHMKSVAVPVAIGVLLSVLHRKYYLAALLSGVCFLVHPITSFAPTVYAFLSILTAVYRKEVRGQVFLKALSIFLLCAGLLVGYHFLSETGESIGALFSSANEGWIDILKSRASYLFIAEWKPHPLARLAYIYALFGLSWWMLKDDLERKIYILLVPITVSAVYIFSFVFVDLLAIPAAFQFQPMRGIFMLTTLAHVMVSIAILRFFLRPDLLLIDRVLIITGLVLMNWIDPLRVDFNIVGFCLLIAVCLYHWAGSFGVSRWVFYGIGLAIITLAFYLSPITIMKFDKLLQDPTRILTTRINIALTVVVVIELMLFVRRMNLNSALKYRKIGVILVLVLLAVPGFDALKTWYSIGHYPGEWAISNLERDQAWKQIQLWAAVNTGVDQVFMVPPREAGFRVWSKRSIVGDNKDGGPAIYSEAFAKEWKGRMKILKNYQELDFEGLRRIGATYGAIYAIVNKEHAARKQLPLIYDNGAFGIVRLGSV